MEQTTTDNRNELSVLGEQRQQQYHYQKVNNNNYDNKTLSLSHHSSERARSHLQKVNNNNNKL